MATTIIEKSREECEKEAAKTIARLLTKSVHERGKAVLGISGGRSVQGVLKQMLTQEVPWNNVHIMMTDERCVSLNSLESNYRQAHESIINALLSAKKLPSGNAHPFIYNEAHAIKAVLKYHQTLESLGGFDVILASAGEDGHIASLFPKHHSTQKENVGFFLIHDAPKPPAKRMTASRKLLLKSRAGVLLVFGKEKAWTAFNDPSKTVLECPIKLITQLPESQVFRSQE